MRGFITVLFAVMGFFLIIVGMSEESNSSAPAEKEFRGTSNLNSLVSPITINNYFVKNTKYWKSCDDQKSKIRNQEDGYKLEKYRNGRVTDINSGRGYLHNISKKEDGSFEMTVELTCEYNVTVQVSALAYATEKMERPGGTILFDMNILEQAGKYRLVGMKAKNFTP